MKSWMKPLLATVIIFGTGLVTGSMLSGTLADQRHPAAQPARPQNPDQPPAAERHFASNPVSSGFLLRIDQFRRRQGEQDHATDRIEGRLCSHLTLLRSVQWLAVARKFGASVTVLFSATDHRSIGLTCASVVEQDDFDEGFSSPNK